MLRCVRRLVILLLLGVAFISQAAKANQETFSMAVMLSPGQLFHEEIVNDLITTIKFALGGNIKLDLFFGTSRQIQKKIEKGELDLVFCNSVLYRSLVPFGVRDLATIHSHWNPNPNRAEGATVVVLRNSNIDSLLSLFQEHKAKKLIGADREFDVLYYVLNELHQQGLNPDKFLQNLTISEQSNEAVLQDVIKGEAVAGLLPSCFLEQYAVSHPQVFREIKVLNALRSSEVPCTVSTTLFPNWSVVITPKISMKQATDIALALLAKPHEANRSWWSVSTQFEHVDALLKELKVEQYTYLREWTLKGFIERYFFILFSLGVVIIGIVFYSLFANRLIKIRSRQLSMSLARQSQYKKNFELAQKNIDAFRRMGILTQISSIISHELKQPLNTISCYAQGLLLKLESGKISNEKCIEIVYEISEKTQAANKIIQKIRNFSKYGRHPIPLEINTALQNAIDSYVLGGHGAEEIQLKKSLPCYVKIDPFEFELIIVNLGSSRFVGNSKGFHL